MLEVGLEDSQADPEQLHQDVHLVVLGRLRGVEKETQIISKVILTYRLMVRHIMHLTSGGISNLITVITKGHNQCNKLFCIVSLQPSFFWLVLQALNFCAD